MSEFAINLIIGVGFVVITAACLVYAFLRGRRMARSAGASDKQLSEALGKARSKIGLIVGLVVGAGAAILLAAWLYLDAQR